ncbi:Heterogeneous nuclear ribonucleoprotein L [Nymphon striatum]|nr:Heterogeneous nuclear ribonucleoprotein L [Nymphon striatum]
MANYEGGHPAKRMKVGEQSDDRDIIHTIASPLGKVLRIVIFKKNGVQAMVEYPFSTARRAKLSLNGADIYSGCCTLKIEYAKPDRLNVYKNDSESFDYTNPNLDKPGNDGQRSGPLLQDPPGYGAAPQPYRDPGPPRRGSAFGGGRNRDDDFDNFGPDPHYGPDCGPERYGPERPDLESRGKKKYSFKDMPDSRFGGRDNFRNGGGPTRGPPGPPQSPPYNSQSGGQNGGGNSQQGSVMMVYGMSHEKMNCIRVFNLFCLYGNVLRVKFLKTKEGCAMVQMGDPISVDRTIYNLNNLEFFEKKMQLAFSKQPFLNEVQNPFDLPDGSPSFKAFLGNRNNRFTNADAASKNRISHPSKMVHFFNTPFGITEDDLKIIFSENEVVAPVTIKMFSSKTERSSSGLMEFETTMQAVEAIVMCNHAAITIQNAKFPFTMKLCFSSAGLR